MTGVSRETFPLSTVKDQPGQSLPEKSHLGFAPPWADSLCGPCFSGKIQKA